MGIVESRILLHVDIKVLTNKVCDTHCTEGRLQAMIHGKERDV